MSLAGPVAFKHFACISLMDGNSGAGASADGASAVVYVVLLRKRTVKAGVNVKFFNIVTRFYRKIRSSIFQLT